MQGIHILSESLVKNNNIDCVFIGIFFGIIALCCAYFLITAIIYVEGVKIIANLLGFIILGFLSFVLIYGHIIEIPHKEYKVITDNNVKLNDFYKYYKIISYENNIFTVRQIENNK